MTYEQILSKLTALCSRSEHCCHDIKEKLRRWEIDETTSQKVIDYLKKEKYIDDSRYARFFVNDKVKFNKWGRRKVEQALRMKGIAEEDYEEALSSVEDADYESVLQPLLKSKMKSVKAKNDYEFRMKLIRFALGRGFSYEQITRSLDNLLANKE